MLSKDTTEEDQEAHFKRVKANFVTNYAIERASAVTGINLSGNDAAIDALKAWLILEETVRDSIFPDYVSLKN